MKNKKGKNNKTETKGENFLKLKTETKHGILAVIFFVLALFFLMSVFELAGVAENLFMTNFTICLASDTSCFRSYLFYSDLLS